MKYDFRADSRQSLGNKGDVYFKMNTGNVNPNMVRELLAGENIGFRWYSSRRKELFCLTDMETYQKQGDCKLEHNPNKKGLVGYTAKGYKEETPAQIWDCLTDAVEGIKLEIRKW